MAQPLLIIGAGGHGREVLDVVDAINAVSPAFEVLGFLADGHADTELLHGRGHEVLGVTADLLGPLAQLDAGYVIAIGDGKARRRIDFMLRPTDRPCPVLVHPDTTIGPDVELGAGTVVCAGARFGNHIRLGRHVHVNMGCTVHHDSVLEPYVTLSPGVHVNGAAVLREAAFLGTAATITPGCTVGADAIVGAGGVVVDDIPPATTVKGVPARP